MPVVCIVNAASVNAVNPCGERTGKHVSERPSTRPVFGKSVCFSCDWEVWQFAKIKRLAVLRERMSSGDSNWPRMNYSKQYDLARVEFAHTVGRKYRRHATRCKNYLPCLSGFPKILIPAQCFAKVAVEDSRLQICGVHDKMIEMHPWASSCRRCCCGQVAVRHRHLCLTLLQFGGWSY